MGGNLFDAYGVLEPTTSRSLGRESLELFFCSNDSDRHFVFRFVFCFCALAFCVCIFECGDSHRTLEQKNESTVHSLLFLHDGSKKFAVLASVMLLNVGDPSQKSVARAH